MWVSLSSAIVIAMATGTVNRACVAGLGQALQQKRACKSFGSQRKGLTHWKGLEKGLLLPELNKQDELTTVPRGVEAKGAVRGPPTPPPIPLPRVRRATRTHRLRPPLPPSPAPLPIHSSLITPPSWSFPFKCSYGDVRGRSVQSWCWRKLWETISSL